MAVRAFIGIDFDSGCKRNIYDLQQKLRNYSVKGRWKHSDNFHLTLKFLGEINAQRLSRIDGALKAVCAGRPQFRLGTGEPGVFGGRDSIRVLWLGLEGDLKQLRSLAAEIDQALVPVGFEPEKRGYSPHITLGQDILFECPFKQIREIAGYEKTEQFPVKSVVLFQSEQIGNRRVYTKVSEYFLQEGT